MMRLALVVILFLVGGAAAQPADPAHGVGEIFGWGTATLVEDHWVLDGDSTVVIPTANCTPQNVDSRFGGLAEFNQDGEGQWMGLQLPVNTGAAALSSTVLGTIFNEQGLFDVMSGAGLQEDLQQRMRTNNVSIQWNIQGRMALNSYRTHTPMNFGASTTTVTYYDRTGARVGSAEEVYNSLIEAPPADVTPEELERWKRRDPTMSEPRWHEIEELLKQVKYSKNIEIGNGGIKINIKTDVDAALIVGYPMLLEGAERGFDQWNESMKLALEKSLETAEGWLNEAWVKMKELFQKLGDCMETGPSNEYWQHFPRHFD